MNKLGATLLIWLSLCMATCALAQERTLEWESLTVTARLDADGALRVTERHAMVFDGDWNGGERTFQLRSWQSLTLLAVREIDLATQVAKPMREGDLSNIGDYQLNGTVLRWRSRLPTDPPFAGTLKIYELEYELGGVLIPENGIYRFEHDLAFPDRSGTIRTFDATLQIDPVWVASDVPTSWHREDLFSGESVFVTAEFKYTGTGQPAAVASETEIPSATSAPTLRYALLLTLMLFITLHVIALLRREQRNGRFQPPVPLEEIDEHWLRTNVFDRPAEVVGAAWDLDTSASEVAALIARLTQAGALKTEVRVSGSGWFKRENLHMELLWSRGRFVAHEHALIAALFFDGSNTTDTEKIRKRYKTSGFSPAALIQRGIESQLPVVFASRLAVPLWSRALTIALFLASLVTFVLGVTQMPDDDTTILLAVWVPLVSLIAGLLFAYNYRANVHHLRGRLLRTLVCVAAMYTSLAFLLLSGRFAFVFITLVSLTLFALASVNSIFNMMRVRDVRESLDLRRRLVSARIYFEHELGKPQPQLKDEWFPYLLAFGLGRHIDRWFKSIAPAASRGTFRGGHGTADRARIHRPRGRAVAGRSVEPVRVARGQPPSAASPRVSRNPRRARAAAVVAAVVVARAVEVAVGGRRY